MVLEEKISSVHKITLENREKMFICGVEDVESFDENEIVVLTSEGTLFIKGSSLHICSLNTDNGELKIEGIIDSAVYGTETGKSGFFGRLIR